jgi:hypothetical protein
MSNSPAIDEAIRATVPGSKWYYLVGRTWKAVAVKRVTATLVILADGSIRVPKSTRWANGFTWFPPTPEMIELYEAQEMRASAQTLYLAALAKLQEAARSATPTQLRHLVTQMENVIDLSGIKP